MAQKIAEAEASPFSFSMGVDSVTQYFFRGILQEDDGFIAQPWAEMGVNLYSGDGLVNSIDWSIGTWHSLHEQHTGTDSNGPAAWYESDVYTGLSFGLAQKWSFAVTYTWYNSPNSAFDDVQDIALTLGYDDSKMWSSLSEAIPGFAGFVPYVTVVFETDRAADGAHEGVYVEFGIEPGLTPLPNSGLEDLSISFPVTVGLSADEYYESPTNGGDESFGYVEAGINFTYPIAPGWELSAGPYFLFLGNTAESFNDGEDNGFEVIGKFGISISF